MGSYLVSDRGIRWEGEDLLLTIRVTPGASTETVERDEQWIRARIHARAQDGQANKQLIKLLGKLFGVPMADIILERGQTSRTKTVRVRAPARLPTFVKAQD